MADQWDQFPDADPFAQFPDAPATGQVNGRNPQTALGLANSVASQQSGGIRRGEGGFQQAFDAGLIRDKETLRKRLAETMFPDDPKGADRIGFDDSGRPIFVNNAGEVQYVSSGVVQFLANTVANVPEMVLGGVGSISSSPVLGGMLGVGGARALKNSLVGLIYDEPQTAGGNLVDAGKEAAIEGAFGTVAKGGIAIANRGRSIDFRPRDISGAADKRARIFSETGVETDLAAASGDRKMLSLRNYLAQQPNSTADAIQAADEAALSQFDDATRRVLDSIAPAQSSGDLGQAGIDAARGSIESARKGVSKSVDPLYRQAYDAVPDVTDPAIRAFMDRPAFKQADAIAKKLAADEGIPYPDNVYSLERLDGVKRGLDTMIDKAKRAGDRNRVRVLTKAKKEFTDSLDSLSNDLYKGARAEYQRLYKEQVEPLEKGWVGVLARMDDKRAATAAAKILKDANVMPKDIALVRSALAKEDPEAWNKLVRQFVANEWNRARRATQGAAESNSPGKLFQAIWGDEAAVARMTAALGMNGVMALKSLMEAAEVLAKVPVRGSNTQPNQAIRSALEGPSGWWAKVLLNPRSTAVNAAAEKSVERNSALLWEALMDPAKQSQLRIAVSISDPAKRAAYISSVILGQASSAAAATTRTRESDSE